MIRLVQQNRCAFRVVDRDAKEWRVERQDLKGKVCRRVRALVTDVPVPPVVGTSVRREMAKDERFLGETGAIENVNRCGDRLTVVVTETVGRDDQGKESYKQQRKRRAADPQYLPAKSPFRR